MIQLKVADAAVRGVCDFQFTKGLLQSASTRTAHLITLNYVLAPVDIESQVAGPDRPRARLMEDVET